MFSVMLPEYFTILKLALENSELLATFAKNEPLYTNILLSQHE